MTTRNFRVNNGLTVGDIVISASSNTITGLATAAPSADGDVANKKYVDDSLSGLSQNSISQGDSNVTVTDTGTGAVTIAVDGSTVISTAAAGATVTGTLTSTGIGTFATGSAVGNLTLANGSITDSSGAISFGDENLTTTGSVNGATGNFTGAVGVDGNFDVATNKLTVNATSGNTAVAGTLDVTGAASFADAVTITGNLTVNGTETIINTQNLSVEDAIISTNTNISNSANMPRFSGLHLHRGTGSSATELDPYFVWDDQYDVSGGSGLGGTFTAMASVHQAGTETPNTDFTLADIRCNIIEATATTAQYADIAERFEADAEMTPGAVVMLGGTAEITETSQELSDRVFGVISTQPAYMMNNAAGSNATHPFVAMTGRTPVRVTGQVSKGDRLVSSSIKGTARAVTEGETINPFHVIGRALEDKFTNEIGLVNCVVRTNN
jgi:hypothetical protein